MSITLEVRKLLKKADHALEVAEELKRKNYHSDAASKVYYAMFYAAQALLKSLFPHHKGRQLHSMQKVGKHLKSPIHSFPSTKKSMNL